MTDVTRPLCVDLDGTLTGWNTLRESILGLVCHSPFSVFFLPRWAGRGGAFFRQQVASQRDARRGPRFVARHSRSDGCLYALRWGVCAPRILGNALAAQRVAVVWPRIRAGFLWAVRLRAVFTFS